MTAIRTLLKGIRELKAPIWLSLARIAFLAFLLIPGNSQLVQDTRVYVALWAIVVLPGYIGVQILALCGYHLVEESADWLERWTAHLALGSVLGLIPWALVFFFGIAIPVVAQMLIAFDAVGLVALVLLELGTGSSRWPEKVKRYYESA